MRRPLNLWLLVIAVVCGLSIWYGRGMLLPENPIADLAPTGSRSERFTAETEQPVHLLVLNGTSVGGLAREFSLLLGKAGCVVEEVGNAPPGSYPESILVNRRLEPGRAANPARRLGGIPVLREWDGRTTEDAVLVLGKDHASIRRELGGPDLQ